jgi:F1F0 ATPase subunit 2
MTDSATLAWAALAGVALGAMFFGGLFWSVRKVMTTRRPAVWMFASLLSRMGLVLGGFYVVCRADGVRWAACAAGFVLARVVATYAATRNRETVRAAEATHAPES